MRHHRTRDHAKYFNSRRWRNGELKSLHPYLEQIPFAALNANFNPFCNN
jgi:hypothetical protein